MHCNAGSEKSALFHLRLGVAPFEMLFVITTIIKPHLPWQGFERFSFKFVLWELANQSFVSHPRHSMTIQVEKICDQKQNKSYGLAMLLDRILEKKSRNMLLVPQFMSPSLSSHDSKIPNKQGRKIKNYVNSFSNSGSAVSVTHDVKICKNGSGSISKNHRFNNF